MRSNKSFVRRVGLATLCSAAAFACVAAPSAAQDSASPLAAGYDAEQRGDWQAAASSYKQALHAGGNTAASILGLERVYSELNHTDSLLPILDTVISQRPKDAVFRSVQLRALRMLGRADD